MFKLICFFSESWVPQTSLKREPKWNATLVQSFHTLDAFPVSQYQVNDAAITRCTEPYSLSARILE